MFASAEEAQQWREATGERLQQSQEGSVRQPREVVAEAVSEQFAQHGEGAEALKTPWEHSQEEHTEAQQLVNVAFAQDLRAALKQARGSASYPRNIDLFHDVLTNELYETLVEYRLNRQPLLGWLLAIVGVGVVGLIAGLLLYLI